MLAITAILSAWLAIMGGSTIQAEGTSPLDLRGERVNPLQSEGARLVVLVFVRTDCPVSNKYAPEIQRLQTEFARRGVAFWLVYPDPSETAAAIREHRREYGYTIDAARDVAHTLVAKAQVRFTPEAAVFAPDGRLLYHGRIDDRYVDLGKARPAPTSRDLETAIDASLAGRPVAAAAPPAAGCAIPSLR
jgi:peroxiredoxin